MQPKEYLRQLQRRDARINALIERQRHYYDLATRITPGYRQDGGGGSSLSASSRVADCAAKIADLEREIDRRIDEYVDLTREIEAAIDRIPDGRYRDVLRFRYVNGWTWEKIADEMGYDLRWVHRLHGHALEKIEVPEERGHKKPL